MVITAVAVGTRGDVNPLAELGEEMIKRGHEFRILTSEAFRPLIESKGVTYLKLDTEADHVMQYLVAEYKTSIDFMKGMFKLKKEKVIVISLFNSNLTRFNSTKMLYRVIIELKRC